MTKKNTNPKNKLTDKENYDIINEITEDSEITKEDINEMIENMSIYKKPIGR